MDANNNDFKPIASGVTRAPDAIIGDAVPAQQGRLSATTRLSDLSAEYAFYHPGLLYNLVPLHGRDPFVDFASQYGSGDLRPLSFRFDEPVVVGFERCVFPEWGYLLHAIEKKAFVAYLAFLGSAMFVDRNAGVLWRLRYKEFKIIDPCIMGKPATNDAIGLSRVTLTTISLDTNHGCWFYRHKFPWQLALAFSTNVFEDTRALAEAVLQESSRPLAELPAHATAAESDSQNKSEVENGE